MLLVFGVVLGGGDCGGGWIVLGCSAAEVGLFGRGGCLGGGGLAVFCW